MPRHNLTNVDATGIGETIATSLKHKAGKSNIWNPDVVSDFTTDINYDQLATNFASSSCEVEYLRMLKTNELRKRLSRLRLKHRNESNINKLLPAVTALERWFMRYQLENSDRCTRNQVQGDPVIPTIWKDIKSNTTSKKKEGKVGNHVDEGLVSDLVIAKESKIVAALVASDIRDEAHQLSTELLNVSRKQKTDRKNNLVIIERHKHTIDVKFHQKMLKINPLHYDKLKVLFDRTVRQHPNLSHSAAAADSEYEGRLVTNDAQEVHDDLFHQCLFCVLARYHTIQGHGFQAAVCEQAFDILLQHLKVSFECFASPLNSRYGQYCSAFADTDACFGSLGSFFQFYPKSGSFEANPPFEPTVMLRMINHIHTLLDASDGAMSFVIIVPGWTECESWHVMNNSTYKTRQVELLAKDDHGFCDGASHQRRDRYRDSTFDTAVFFLQNKQGAIAYKVTDECILEFKASMAQGKPSPAMRLRQEKEGRGTADACRGVYKGKKRNATGEGVMSRKSMERAQKAEMKSGGGNTQHKNKKRK